MRRMGLAQWLAYGRVPAVEAEGLICRITPVQLANTVRSNTTHMIVIQKSELVLAAGLAALNTPTCLSLNSL